MPKLICHFKAKPGLSREEFRDYYENNHVPLIGRLLPPMADYRRSYMTPGGTFFPGHVVDPPSPPDFDVVTECWYSDQAWELMLQRTQDPEIGRQIAEDEEKFLDRQSMVMFVVDERCGYEKL